MRCPKCGTRLESKAKLCPKCKRPVVARIPRTTSDSHYSDALESRSTVDVRGLGSRLNEQSKVASVRHRIGGSDDLESTQKIRCMKCGTVNDKGSRFCRKCRTRFT